MKKIFGILMFVITSLVFTTSCRTVDAEKCVELGLEALELAFYETVSECNAYKTAQQKYIDKCLSGEAKDVAQMALDEVSCVE